MEKEKFVGMTGQVLNRLLKRRCALQRKAEPSLFPGTKCRFRSLFGEDFLKMEAAVKFWFIALASPTNS